MDVIKEKGVFLSECRRQDCESGQYYPCGFREFHYSAIVWFGDLKFLLGSWDKPKGSFEVMLEVITGAVAVDKASLYGKKPTIENFIEAFKERLSHYKASCGGQMVDKFLLTYKIQLWQINLWVM